MRQAEAARYARWAGIAALVIAATVTVVYVTRAVRAARARRQAPQIVLPTVQQQTAEFAFSKVEQDRTIYTVRASRATEFKDRNQSLLEDVSITLYGRDGERNDNIHTRECSYEPSTGRIRCAGAVQINIEPAPPSPDVPDGGGGIRGGEGGMEVDTNDITFDRDAGVASTTQKVKFRFPEGEGQATGVTYTSEDGVLRLNHDVMVKIRSTKQADTLPITITGSKLEYERKSHVARLAGPAYARWVSEGAAAFGPSRGSGASARQGDRELTAGAIVLELDKQLRARKAVVEGNPEIHVTAGGNSIAASAEKFELNFDLAGRVLSASADGGVNAEKKGTAGNGGLQAQSVQIEMEPNASIPREMDATGNVKLGISGRSGTQQIETTAMKVTFAPGAGASETRLASAETMAPATIRLAEASGAETATEIHATKARSEFDEQNRIRGFHGESGVKVTRAFAGSANAGRRALQETTARELDVTFAAGGDWERIELDGNVRFQEGNRTARAGRAEMTRASDTIQLIGSSVLADTWTRTTAPTMQIEQKTGKISATGGVQTTYLNATGPANPALGSGAAHISAEALTGATADGHFVYSGHARLWQGDAVLNANTIELFRQEQRIEARGNVAAVFPQAPGPGHTDAAPVRWEVRAPRMQYWSASAKGSLDGGVVAESEDGSLHSETLDFYLTPNGSGGNGSGIGSEGSGRGAGTAPSSGRLERAMAVGAVAVMQAGRKGTAERLDYTAADGKFVLSGGEPTLTDATNDTTTGRSLTFFIASDTILVDSGAGSRTLTKHRVEK